MKPYPTPFGFPVVIGKAPKRLVKKILRGRWHFYAQFNNTKVGDTVVTCTGLNEKIVGISARYFTVGKIKILGDVDLQCEHTGCSLNKCGIDSPLSLEDSEKARSAIIDEWKENDAWGFAKNYSTITFLPDGRYLKAGEAVCEKCGYVRNLVPCIYCKSLETTPTRSVSIDWVPLENYNWKHRYSHLLCK